jgi:hypothetical protein
MPVASPRWLSLLAGIGFQNTCLTGIEGGCSNAKVFD